MNVLDLTLSTPADNLALDEALLDWCETGAGTETLRFWESPQYFVVVGYANKVDLEVNRAACEAAGVPILRRCSGGGTVLQGPGCLNYNLVLEIEPAPGLHTIPQTNDFVMERQRRAVEIALGNRAPFSNEGRNMGSTECRPTGGEIFSNPPPVVRGHTDLALGTLKFSGNAQRRKRQFLVFHGTFLLNFDLPLIAKLLKMPSKEPDYRQNRDHDSFLTNLNTTADRLKAALREVWNAHEPLPQLPDWKQLVEEKYRHDEWNLKF